MVVGVTYAAGIGLASLAAFASALYFLCVRLGTDNGRVLDVVLVSLIVNVILIVPLVGVIYGIPHVTVGSILAFAGAGLAGSFLARLLMTESIDAIGASRTAPVVASNVLFASLLAVLIFGEQISTLHLLGIVCIVAGVAAITWEMSRDSHAPDSLRDLGLTLMLPIGAAVLIGVEPILVTIGLNEGTAVLPGVAIKGVAATTGFVSYLIITRALDRGMIRWSQNSKWYVGAGVTSTVAITAYFAALSVAPVVIVVPLIQTAPLLVLVLSALFLPQRLERVTGRLVAGATIVVIGATLVSLFG